MTENGKFKRQVRERAARTGESYTAARRQLRPRDRAEVPAYQVRLRLAVAQNIAPPDPRDPVGLRAAGREIRGLMREARARGARLVHFPEGATCVPAKQIMSVDGPEKVGPADWSRFRWDVLAEEIAATAATARELRLWVVLGSVHRLTAPNRPHNSLYVISDAGEVVTRYDERRLSHTKVTYMYAPGRSPVTFEVDGVRFGCVLGIEAHFPELFTEYERLDVDGVLFSTHGQPGPAQNPAPLALQARALAAGNSYWVSYATTAQDAVNAPSGVISPAGVWMARGPRSVTPAVVVVDLTHDPNDWSRPWRRIARGDVYDAHRVDDDSRSHDRTVL